jgi:transglutaminase-like putative cysteine protease
MERNHLGQAPMPTIQIRLGYELIYDCPQATPMLLTLNVHFSRVSDLVVPDHMITTPSVPISAYRDSFGNWCSRLVAPAGEIRFSADAVINDSGLPDPVVSTAWQVPVESLPEETLVFLLGSRYCDTERLSQVAWDLFGRGPTGWARVQAICEFVHNHIAFDYQKSRPSRTAFEAFNEKQGVCRDFTHLAIAFCRCLNIPARYCTGYLGEIGVPPAPPGDFSAWFEVYLSRGWHVFDARNNTPRIGRVLIARGRDAADVPISNTFGFTTLKSFHVWTDKVDDSLPGTHSSNP